MAQRAAIRLLLRVRGTSTQNDYTLTMPAFEDDFTLVLLDEDGVVVYTTYVPAGTTMIVLPSTLSGDFELRLVGDTYYYRGYISL